MLDYFIKWAPEPQARQTDVRAVSASEDLFSGFVFKIQANMDPKHRDRMAFLRICSGKYKKGMKIKQVRTGKLMRISDAVGFKAGSRISLDAAEAGDIIGFHNHGSIQIGDTFTEGEQLRFAGIPYFAPELFKRIRLRDPLKTKQLRMGIKQLSEEVTDIPLSFSIAIQSETACRSLFLALTVPAIWIILPSNSNFSVIVVLPASG